MEENFRERIQKGAIEIALKNDRCGLDIAVRLGKTYIGISIAEKFKKVLVGYPNCPIKNGWVNDSIKFGISIENITFTTYLSLNKYNLNDFDCIILDEVDTVSEAVWSVIEKYNPKVIKGLSGTMPKSGLKRDYIDEYCPILYTKKLDETTGKTSKDYQIIVHLLKPNEKKDIPLKSGKYWSEKAKISFWENKYRQTRDFTGAMLPLIQSIQNSETKFNYLKNLSNKIDRGLIFVETTKQCEELGFLSYNSKESNSERNLELFKKEEINKLSTVNQLKAGVTIENVDTCIILHSYASQSKSHQKLARVLNYSEGESATIHILCLDNTKDKDWCIKALEQFDKNKIQWINIQ